MTSLAEILHTNFIKNANFVALKFSEVSYTYEEVNYKAVKVANSLISLGADNEAIAIVGQRNVNQYLGIIGTLYSNCHYVPINTKYKKERVLKIIKKANIRFFIGDEVSLLKIKSIIDESNISSNFYFITPNDECSNEKWIDKKSLNKVNPLPLEFIDNPDRLIYTMFTSGSTGEPKGVMVSNKNIISWLNSMTKIYDLKEGFKASQIYDLSFDLSVSDMFFTWANGGVLCILSEDEKLMPFDYIRREKIEFWSSVPTVASFMEKMGLLKENVFPSIKYSVFCGEPFPKSLADMWKKAAPLSSIENSYGPTEATIWITRFSYEINNPSYQSISSILPIGKIYDGHEMKLINENNSLITGNNQKGELVYKGPQITLGYLNNEKKTKESFRNFDWDSEGAIWYRSGDIGFINENGDFECLGRTDNQIKIAGRRLEIGEVETAIRKYEKTKDAIIIPLRDENNLVKYLIAFSTIKLSKDEEKFVKLDLNNQIEKIFIPKKIIFIPKLPLTYSGKVDRKLLESKLVTDHE
tara:strand:+ start:93 stop:1670 length:1578 start_codon:yes stop_codon:yes gene_type:complete